MIPGTSVLEPAVRIRPSSTATSWSPAIVSWVLLVMPSGRVPTDSVRKRSSEPVTLVMVPEASTTKPVPSRPTTTWGESTSSSSGAALEEKSVNRSRLVAQTLPSPVSAISTVFEPWLYSRFPVVTRVPIVRVAVSMGLAALSALSCSRTRLPSCEMSKSRVGAFRPPSMMRDW